MAAKVEGADRRAGWKSPISLDAVLLFLLLFLDLPSEERLEFGRMMPDVAAAGGWMARLFEGSLVKNPIGAIETSVAVGLLVLYGLIAAGVLLRRRAVAGRAAIVALLVAWIVFLPAVGEIALRFAVGPSGHAHDGGVIQTEEAARFLLAGENPYAADFRTTPMAALPWGPGNPAIIHHPYFPLSFLVHVPFRAAGNALFGGYDARVLYLLLFCVPFFLVPRWSADPERKLCLAMLWGLNPFLVPHVVEGRNDVVVAVLLVAALHALLAGRRSRSALLVGAACATKQFAFLLLPFYVVSLGGAQRTWGATLRSGVRAAWPLLVPLVLFVLPFVLWDPGAFLDDTWAFNVGLSEVSYPLGGTPGYGAAALVNVFHLVPTRYHYFPFWIFQVLLVLPAGWLLLRRHRAVPSVASLAVSFALFLFLFLFFSRIFHHNYFGLIFFYLAAPLFGERLSAGGPARPAGPETGEAAPDGQP